MGRLNLGVCLIDLALNIRGPLVYLSIGSTLCVWVRNQALTHTSGLKTFRGGTFTAGRQCPRRKRSIASSRLKAGTTTLQRSMVERKWIYTEFLGQVNYLHIRVVYAQ